MYYVYILLSLKDKKFYTGYTNDLRRRFNEHKTKTVFSTKSRLPLKLVYYEVCLNLKDVEERERYLKSTWGKRYVKNRIKNYLKTL